VVQASTTARNYNDFLIAVVYPFCWYKRLHCHHSTAHRQCNFAVYKNKAGHLVKGRCRMVSSVSQSEVARQCTCLFNILYLDGRYRIACGADAALLGPRMVSILPCPDGQESLHGIGMEATTLQKGLTYFLVCFGADMHRSLL